MSDILEKYAKYKHLLIPIDGKDGHFECPVCCQLFTSPAAIEETGSTCVEISARRLKIDDLDIAEKVWQVRTNTFTPKEKKSNGFYKK